MKTRKLLCLILTVGAILFALQMSTAYAEFPYGDLGGTVTDANTNAPIVGATVDIGYGSPALTDALGRYLFHNAPIGSYTVTASKSGYLPETVSGVAVIERGETVQDFALNAPPALANYQGTVDDFVTDLPIEGAAVELTGGYATTTNAAGNFLFTGLPTGDYTVTVSKTGYVTYVFTLTINAPTTTSLISLHPIPPNVIPEVPLGTLLASIAMAAGIAGFIAVPKLRKRIQ